MRSITELIEKIEDELELSRVYTKNYLIYNTDENKTWSLKFKAMAEESLKHADAIDELLTETLLSIQKAYTLPEELVNVCDKKHSEYVSSKNWLKELLK